MLNTLRAFFLRRSLRKMLASQKRRRKTHTLESAHTVGILFDATEEKDRKEVLHFAQTLEKQRKRVKLLGFVDAQKPLGQTQFPQFTQKEIRWNGSLHSESIDAFIAEPFDVLLCLNARQVLSVEWVAAAAQAAMKIGTLTESPNDFDMVLETPAQKGVQFFVDQLELYLHKIVPAKYESAATL